MSCECCVLYDNSQNHNLDYKLSEYNAYPNSLLHLTIPTAAFLDCLESRYDANLMMDG